MPCTLEHDASSGVIREYRLEPPAGGAVSASSLGIDGYKLERSLAGALSASPGHSSTLQACRFVVVVVMLLVLMFVFVGFVRRGNRQPHSSFRNTFRLGRQAFIRLTRLQFPVVKSNNPQAYTSDTLSKPVQTLGALRT